MIEKTVGFLGFGNMGAAILEGLVEKKVLPLAGAVVYDPSPSAIEAAQALGVTVAPDPEALAQSSDVLILAVKPQIMDAALAQIAPHLAAEALIISIAAGISSAYIQDRLGADTRVIRVMPNTPYLVHAGAAGIAASPQCDAGDRELAHNMFASIGVAVEIDESKMDAVTALSGSGPAYFFYMVECLVAAAVKEGLDPDVAAQLAGQTLYGAGKLLMESPDSAATLREKVTSPGGTTEAALNAFRAEGLEAVVAKAVAAAVHRGRELGAKK